MATDSHGVLWPRVAVQLGFGSGTTIPTIPQVMRQCKKAHATWALRTWELLHNTHISQPTRVATQTTLHNARPLAPKVPFPLTRVFTCCPEAGKHCPSLAPSRNRCFKSVSRTWCSARYVHGPHRKSLIGAIRHETERFGSESFARLKKARPRRCQVLVLLDRATGPLS